MESLLWAHNMCFPQKASRKTGKVGHSLGTQTKRKLRSRETRVLLVQRVNMEVRKKISQWSMEHGED